MHRVGGKDVLEQFVGVGKLRRKLLFQVVADLVAAAMDSRADGGPQVLRFRSEGLAHLAYTFLDDARQRPPPSRMKAPDCALDGINDQYWNAIGRADRK